MTEQEVFSTLKMIREMKELGLKDKVFPTSEVIDKYFMEAKEKGKAEEQKRILEILMDFLYKHFKSGKIAINLKDWDELKAKIKGDGK